MRWLEEHAIGWNTRAGKVPIVPAASFYDLHIGGKPVDQAGGRLRLQGGAGRDGRAGGRRQCRRGRRRDGRPDRRSPHEIGHRQRGDCAAERPRGRRDRRGQFGRRHHRSGDRPGARGHAPRGRHARRRAQGLAIGRAVPRFRPGDPRPRPGENTTIGVVATNARLTKAQASRMALMADAGYARAINPIHTLNDGDTVFALATGRWDGAGRRVGGRRARGRSDGRRDRAGGHPGDRPSGRAGGARSSHAEDSGLWRLILSLSSIQDVT